MAKHGSKRSWLRRWVLFPLTVVLALASFVPLIETNVFWVRFMDFPRVQISMALILVLGIYLAVGAWRDRRGMAAIGLALASLGYHAYRVHPMVPAFEDVMAPTLAQCSPEARVRVMVANVQRENRRTEELFAIVDQVDPDLLLVMETNEWWDEALQALNDRFPYRIQDIPENATYFGIHLLSRLPLESPEIRFYADLDTPSVVTGVALPGGDSLRFLGVHPRPPALMQPTTMRDATINAAALEARASDEPTVVAGDFNAVPWERINRRAMRIGGLLDPRAGRGFYNTYDVQSRIKRWPLDQILFQDALGLLAFRKLPSFGSDHYPVAADLCYRPAMAAEQSAPPLRDGDLEEAQAALAAARSRQR